MAVPGVAKGGLARTYDAVVVGAGIQGLAVAYELARRGVRRICVLDAAWPGAGSSGRNGEMIRSAFASEAWCRLFDRALVRWRGLSGELGMNVLFTTPGYLIVAATAGDLDRYRGWADLQRTLGLRTRMVDADEVRALVPALSPTLATGGLLQEDAGFAHHDATVWAYCAAAARLGVEIHPFTTVTGIDVVDGRVRGVETSRGRVATPLVIDAAGGRAREVAALAGVDLALKTMRLEALVTESLRPFLRPAVALPPLHGYCHQTTRGEFVGGTEQRVMPETDSMYASIAGLRDTCHKFVRAFPLLAGARVMRHWAGIVSHTADLAPILGAAPELDGLWLDAGWVYGFMGAPAAGELLARAIVEGSVPAELAPFAPGRIAAGRLIAEGSLVGAPKVGVG